MRYRHTTGSVPLASRAGRTSAVRVVLPSVLAILLAAFAAPLRAQNIAAADLQIEGSGLRLVTVSATTAIDVPVSVQTEFGGK